MKPFLLFEEQIKLVEKFSEWCKKVKANDVPVNMLLFLHDHDAINIDNCREIIKEHVPVTDELTKDTFKQAVNQNLKQKAVLMDINNDISDRMKCWGENGRLIDRDFVFAFLTNIMHEVETALKEED